MLRFVAKKRLSTAGSLLGRHAPEKSEITAARHRAEGANLAPQAMVHGRHPVELGPRPALAVRDGNERHFAALPQQRLQVGHIQPAVERGQGPDVKRAKQGEMQWRLDVKMQDIELVRALAHPLQLQHEVREWIAHCGIEAQGARGAGNEPGRGRGVGGGEQGDFVPAPDQLLGKIRDHSLGARHTVGGDAFGQGGRFVRSSCRKPAETTQVLCRDRGLL
jgi:hypothetical protein